MKNTKPIDPQIVLEFAKSAPHSSKVIALHRAGESNKRHEKKHPPRAAASGPAPKARNINFARMMDKLSQISTRPRLTDFPKEALFGRTNAFEMLKPPPGVLPDGIKPMAMDSALTDVTGWAGQGVSNINGAFLSGYAFLGYPFLAQLAQVPEFRKIVETIAREMTRKFIRFTSKSPVQTEDDDEPDEKKEDPKLATDFVDTSKTDEADQADEDDADSDADGEKDANAPEENPEEKRRQMRISKLEEAFETWQVRSRCAELVLLDGLFGRGHLYIDTGDTGNPPELKMPIGDGKNDITLLKFQGKRGFLKRLICVEPQWTYPSVYNANNPLKPTFYAPESWYVMAQEVHCSRLLTVVGRPVPDLLKPSYSFGGLSMTQMAMPYVMNWLNTRQSVGDLVQDYSKRGIRTNLAALTGADGPDIVERMNAFNMYANNQGTLLLDQATEDFFQYDTNLSGLDKLQAQAQEHMASVSGIPLVKLLGIQPAGLNASSEGELIAFEDLIHAYQETLLRDPLTRILNFAQLSIFGDIDPTIGFIFQPLREMSEKERAEIGKFNAETDGILIDAGAIDAQEVRHRVASDPNMPYGPMDPDELPEPPEGDEFNDEGNPKETDGGAPFGGKPGKDDGGEE